MVLYRGAKAFAPAGQSTQMIIGATPETDRHIMDLTEGLYRKYALRRVFYSAYLPVVEDRRLPALHTAPPLLREHRLYQADWLLRFYGFRAEELLDAGSLRRRVELQNTGDFDDIFIMIADAQALTDNADNPEKVRQNIIEVALDYMACGLDPEKSTLFIQSQVPELTELSFYYMNLVTVSRLQRNPTVKNEIKMRNFEASIPVGFFTYPISQAADITAFKATVVPVGEDQLPMLEQTKEIVHKFNSVYGDTLIDPKILLPENEACLRLPGIDGKAKMSKSLGNCIYLSEESEDIKKKVFSMFTDPNHIRVEDPGSLEGNTVFTYLDAFCKPEYFAEFLPEYQNLDELKAHYQRGGLGDMKVKRFLNNVLQAELEPIRNRRKELQKDIPAIYEILKKGSEKAEAVAAQTLKEVKDAMKINYFDDKALIEAQAERFSK